LLWVFSVKYRILHRWKFYHVCPGKSMDIRQKKLEYDIK